MNAQLQTFASSNNIAAMLSQAGNRATRNNKLWICTTCPPGRSPALKVDGEVYYCHRCRKGGNIITLKKLGLFEKKQFTREEKRAWAVRQQAKAFEREQIKDWIARVRRIYVFRFRKAFDIEIAMNDHGRTLLARGMEVDGKTLSAVVSARQERVLTWWQLDWLDSLSARQIVNLFREVQHVV